MCQFIGREEELRELEAMYRSRGKRTAAVYGRRRLGKTTLLKEFCRDKRHVFLMMAPGSERQNLDAIQDEMSRIHGRKIRYESFPEFLSDLADYCHVSKTVVVIDELPFLLDSAPHVAGYLQSFIDLRMDGEETMLIICGSSVSSMEKETNDPTRPLYNRFRLRLRLQPLTFGECCLFHPSMSDADKARMYLTFGGSPYYHEGVDSETFREAIIDGYLRGNAFLRDEARNVVQELKGSESCMAVLDAISSGRTSIKDISEYTDIQRDSCKRLIDNMEGMGLVSHLVPMCGAPKNPVYYIREGIVRFHYDVVNRSRMIMLNSDPDIVYDQIRGRIDTFLGRRFEDLCADYVARNYPCTKLGKCWGNFVVLDDYQEEPGDIDVVAIIQTREGRFDLFGECKFSRKPVGFSEYNKLERRVESLDGDYAVKYAMFSLSGFEDDFREFAENTGVLLIGLDELVGRRPAPPLVPEPVPDD